MGIPPYYCISYLSPKIVTVSFRLAWLEPEFWGSQKLLVSWKNQGNQVGFLFFLAVFAKGGDSPLEKVFLSELCKLCVQQSLSQSLGSGHPVWDQQTGFSPLNIHAVWSTSASTSIPSGSIHFRSQALFFYMCKLLSAKDWQELIPESLLISQRQKIPNFFEL